MEIKSGIIVLQELIEKYKIPNNLVKDVLPSIDSTRQKIDLKKIPLAKGTIEVDVKEIEVWINPNNGLFELNGVLGVVYLHTSYTESWNVDELAKWHVTKCATLIKQMNLGKLHEKYALKKSEILTNDFVLTLLSTSQKIKRELRPCKNCLIKLSRIKRSWRDAQTYRFVNYIEEFKEVGNVIDLDLNNFSDAPKPNVYNADFKEKANNYKKNRDNNCDRCNDKFDFNFLEVHHKNRLKYDDSRSNWELLCVTCHLIEHKTDNPRMRALYESKGRLSSFYEKYRYKAYIKLN
jgi:HNH endonuclease